MNSSVTTFAIYICLLYLLIFTVIIATPVIRCTRRQTKVLLVGEVFSLAIIAFCWEPMTNDLTRHFILLDQLRGSDMGFLDFLLHPEIAGTSYKGFFSFNIFRYILVHITENNHFYPFFAVLIDYGIIAYITYDWHFNELKDERINLLEFILCLTFMPYLYSCQGIRNALAASIMALATYQYFCKKKGMRYLFFYTLIAATMHPVVLLVIPCVLLVRINIKKQGYIFIIFSPVLFDLIMKQLIVSPIEYVRRIAAYYLHYTSESQYQAAMYYLYADIALIIIIIILYFLADRSRLQNIIDTKVYSFLIIYLFAIVGFIGNYDLVLRPSYFLGAFSPVISSLIIDKRIWKNKFLIRNLLYIICILIGIYIIMRYMRFYFAWSYNKL